MPLTSAQKVWNALANTVRGHIEQLPSGSFRVHVYAGTGPVTGRAPPQRDLPGRGDRRRDARAIAKRGRRKPVPNRAATRAGIEPGLAHLLSEGDGRPITARGNAAYALDLRDVLNDRPAPGLGPDEALGLQQGRRLGRGAFSRPETID